MKFTFVPVFILLGFTSFLSLNAMTLNLVKRGSVTSQEVEGTFQKISQTILDLKNAQEKAGQSGTPNFQLAAQGLGNLAQLAEKADEQLHNLDVEALDNDASNNVENSLKSSANDVVSITNMIIRGKEWFAKNNVTSKVVQILQANDAQFTRLFLTLNQHIPNEFVQPYKQFEASFLSSIQNAINTLQEGDTGSGKPPGFESCGSSSTNFLKAAYQQQTLGTTKTSCSSTQLVKANTFKMPKNALMM